MSVQLAFLSDNLVRTDTTITESDDAFKSTCCAATSGSQYVIELYVILIDYDGNNVHLLAMLGQKQLVRMSVQFLCCMQSCLPLSHKCIKGYMQEHILQYVMIMNKQDQNTMEQRSKRRKDLNLGSIRQINLSVLIVSTGYPDDSMRCKLGDSHDRCHKS